MQWLVCHRLAKRIALSAPCRWRHAVLPARRLYKHELGSDDFISLFSAGFILKTSRKEKPK